MSSSGKPYIDIILVSVASGLLGFGLAIDTNFLNYLEASRYGLIAFSSALAAGLRPAEKLPKRSTRRANRKQEPHSAED